MYRLGRIELLLTSAVQGALLVLITLALFLDLSLAFWVMLGVPFSMLGALLAINALGLPVSINVMSVFGFILVLGMLVDDGIVTAESAYAQLAGRKTRGRQHRAGSAAGDCGDGIRRADHDDRVCAHHVPRGGWGASFPRSCPLSCSAWDFRCWKPS